MDAVQKIADELLRPLKRIADPAFDSWYRGPQLDALATHMDPPDPVPAVGDGSADIRPIVNA